MIIHVRRCLLQMQLEGAAAADLPSNLKLLPHAFTRAYGRPFTWTGSMSGRRRRRASLTWATSPHTCTRRLAAAAAGVPRRRRRWRRPGNSDLCTWTRFRTSRRPRWHCSSGYGSPQPLACFGRCGHALWLCCSRHQPLWCVAHPPAPRPTLHAPAYISTPVCPCPCSTHLHAS